MLVLETQTQVVRIGAKRVRLSLVLALCLSAWPAISIPAEPPKVSEEQLSKAMRELLLSYMPTTLYEKSTNWGNTDRTPIGLKWKKKGGLRYAGVKQGERKDGVWRKIKLTADNLPKTLDCEIRNVTPGAETTRFDAFLSFRGRVRYEQQNWGSGIRWYSGHIEARFKIKLALTCESTSRFEKSSGLIPDLVFRVRIIDAKLKYHDLVVEHIAGVGGEAAQLIGKALHEAVEELKPGLEKKLLAKANTAIEKAGDTKEIRIGLDGMLKPETKSKP